MPLVTIKRNGIQFFLTNTGAVTNVENYTTYLGLASSTDIPTAAASSSGSFRSPPPVPTLPRSSEFMPPADEERVALLSEAGVNLALCVDEVIQHPPNSYVPLYDQDLTPEDRGPAFGKWVQSHFIHGDLSSHNPDELNYHPPRSFKTAHL
ncbi:hypothetical protein B0H19DRAFT_1267471 [Mycena capillaripes]|nr:hypothetical protein B0H19DRAFT_1267471 [Mycena capillaripes]